MKILVYGTLKKGYWNNRILRTSTLLKGDTVTGFKLYDAGFPVAVPSSEEKISGEVWEIPEEDTTLQDLDRLESNGRMYIRTPVTTDSGEEVQMYVGNSLFWNGRNLHECEKEDGVYCWKE